MRRNKHFITFVCLILGAVLLCSAAVANIGNAGGYEAYKDGLIGLLSLDNFSGKIRLEALFDGESIVAMTYTEKMNPSAGVGEAAGYTSTMVDSHHDEINTAFSLDEAWRVVNPDDHISERKYTSYSFIDYPDYFGSDTWNIDATNSLNGIIDDFYVDPNDESMAKIVNLLEMAADLVVGDLKNNFVYLGEEDGFHSYRVSLTGSQLPEIVNALISLLFDDALYYGAADGYEVIRAVELNLGELSEAEWNRYYELWDEAHALIGAASDPVCYVITEDLTIARYDSAEDYYKTITDLTAEMLLDDMDLFIRLLDGEPEITSAICTLKVDENGMLVENNLEGTVEFELLSGEKHSITVKIDGWLEDVGTTTISLPVIDPSATVYDYSREAESNGYEYTVTMNGVTTVHSRAEEDRKMMQERFFSMNSVDRIMDASRYTTGSWFDLHYEKPEDGLEYYEYIVDYGTVSGSGVGDAETPAAIDIEAAASAEITPAPYGSVDFTPVVTEQPTVTYTTVDVQTVPMDGSYAVYIPVEQFESACRQLFNVGDTMWQYAGDMGMEVEEVIKILLDDYYAITGSEYAGTVYWSPASVGQ